MPLTCHRSAVIDLSDPAKILAADVTCGLIAGVPTIIVQPDALHKNKDRVRDAVDDIIDDALTAERKATGLWGRLVKTYKREHLPYQLAAPFLRGKLMQAYEKMEKQIKDNNFPMPTAHSCPFDGQTTINAHTVDADAYKKNNAAVVIAPSRTADIEDLIGFARNVTRAGCAPLTPGNDVFRYGVTGHEIAHVAGAGEAQADKIGALLARRTFGPTPFPAMMADFRAVNRIMKAATRLDDHMPPLDPHDHYDWTMVDAGDSVTALPQDAINAMTDNDILAHAFEKFPDRSDQTETLARLFNKELAEIPAPPARVPEIKILMENASAETKEAARLLILKAFARTPSLTSLPRPIGDIAAAAQNLNAAIQTRTTDPEVHRMAARLALAATRMAHGNAAYALSRT